MALPTASNLIKMQYAFNAQPFVHIPSKPSIDTTEMQYVYFALPFVTNPYPQTGNKGAFFHFF